MLNKAEIKDLIERKALIEGYISLEKQLNPNGFDLTVAKIYAFKLKGALDFSNQERVIPVAKDLAPVKDSPQDQHGWWDLRPGSYKVRTNETVNLPNNLAGLGFTRTSLLRMGALTQNGVWDAGFQGKGEFILVVSCPGGVRIKENARLVQLVFFPVNETEAYNGIHKHLK